MVSIERQRTHIHFDGLGDVFGALGAELILGKVQGRQRPDGGYGRCTTVWTMQVLAEGVADTHGDVIPLTCTQEWRQREF